MTQPDPRQPSQFPLVLPDGDEVRVVVPVDVLLLGSVVGTTVTLTRADANPFGVPSGCDETLVTVLNMTMFLLTSDAYQQTPVFPAASNGAFPSLPGTHVALNASRVIAAAVQLCKVIQYTDTIEDADESITAVAESLESSAEIALDLIRPALQSLIDTGYRDDDLIVLTRAAADAGILDYLDRDVDPADIVTAGREGIGRGHLTLVPVAVPDDLSELATTSPALIETDEPGPHSVEVRTIDAGVLVGQQVDVVGIEPGSVPVVPYMIIDPHVNAATSAAWDVMLTRDTVPATVYPTVDTFQSGQHPILSLHAFIPDGDDHALCIIGSLCLGCDNTTLNAIAVADGTVFVADGSGDDVSRFVRVTVDLDTMRDAQRVVSGYQALVAGDADQDTITAFLRDNDVDGA